jgi:hypothetical protein
VLPVVKFTLLQARHLRRKRNTNYNIYVTSQYASQAKNQLLAWLSENQQNSNSIYHVLAGSCGENGGRDEVTDHASAERSPAMFRLGFLLTTIS